MLTSLEGDMPMDTITSVSGKAMEYVDTDVEHVLLFHPERHPLGAQGDGFAESGFGRCLFSPFWQFCSFLFSYAWSSSPLLFCTPQNLKRLGVAFCNCSRCCSVYTLGLCATRLRVRWSMTNCRWARFHSIFGVVMIKVFKIEWTSQRTKIVFNQHVHKNMQIKTIFAKD